MSLRARLESADVLMHRLIRADAAALELYVARDGRVLLRWRRLLGKRGEEDVTEVREIEGESIAEVLAEALDYERRRDDRP